jgi:hypothetical protein
LSVFTDSEGKVFVPAEPQNVESLGDKGNSPDMMVCGKGKDGLFYVSANFSGCSYVTCEMLDMFTESGKRLTVNGLHRQKILKEKSIKFPENGWLTIEVPDTSSLIPRLHSN